MFKTLKTLLAGILAAVIVVAIGLNVYTAFAAPSTIIFHAQSKTASMNGNGNGGQKGTGISVLGIPASELSAEEVASLLFMREEEKLARDVYNILSATWGIQSFSNISSSEQIHMGEIKVLLDRYALTDPALSAGQFTNPELHALYTQLVTQGSLSISDALKVGAAIEEIDIRDLQTRMVQTDNADIQQVYSKLLNGSYSHLKTFTSNLLTQTGETYQPQYLNAEQYQTIITSTNGNENQDGNGGQGNHSGNGSGNSNGTTSESGGQSGRP